MSPTTSVLLTQGSDHLLLNNTGDRLFLGVVMANPVNTDIDLCWSRFGTDLPRGIAVSPKGTGPS